MAQLYISHAEEEGKLAEELAGLLEERGYTTWYYERDSVPGLSYLLQTGREISGSTAVVVLISRKSLASNQVTKELVRAHEEAKHFLPILRGVTHQEFQNLQPEWREALGSAVSVALPAEGPAGILARLEKGLRAMKIVPAMRGNEPGTIVEDRSEGGPDGSCAPKSRSEIPRILVVEDDKSVGKLFTMTIDRDIGAETRVAENGMEALEVVRQFRPHIVITDLHMPVMNGVELIRQVQSDPLLNQTVFIAVTGYSDSFERVRKQGIVVLAKPVTSDTLVSHVQRVLASSQTSLPERVPSKAMSTPQTLPRFDVAPGDKELFDQCEFVFTEHCRGHIAILGLSEPAALALVQGEFRSHTNYLRFDMENYPMPLQSGYIVYLNKTGKRVEFTGFVKCTGDQAKLASWNDILALYRRATRLAYRGDPKKVFLARGALARVVELHLDLRTRITKHLTAYEGLPVEERMYLTGGSGNEKDKSSKDAMTDEVAYHLRESARADTEASKIEQMHEAGDLTLGDAVGSAVMELERSLQHIHKIITGYPPIG